VLTLAIETSGPRGSLALCNGDEVFAERTFELGARHGQALVPELRQLLADAGRTPAACKLLAVSIGPGSFTGLRVGVVCAKTWAYATGCRVVAVDTHQAIAANSPAGIDCVEVVSDAQGGDVYFSQFVRAAVGHWESVGELRYLSADDWIATLDPELFVSGPGIVRLESKLAGKCRMLAAELRFPSAMQVARIGLCSAEAQEFSDVWSLEPRYIRRSSAEEKWDLRRRG
jgi:tRNA threonylcarbamoyladenosine biosynthesis protein TsaB